MSNLLFKYILIWCHRDSWQRVLPMWRLGTPSSAINAPIKSEVKVSKCTFVDKQGPEKGAGRALEISNALLQPIRTI